MFVFGVVMCGCVVVEVLVELLVLLVVVLCWCEFVLDEDVFEMVKLYD